MFTPHPVIRPFLFGLILCFCQANAFAVPRIAVLDFELRDLTLLPETPAELARTASVQPLLEAELKKAGFEMVAVDKALQQQSTSGFGYLLDHNDAAAELGKRLGADYVLVGRLHKPSFLFVYLMAHLVDVHNARLVGDYLSEIKGGEKKLTQKGVESLSVKIVSTLRPVR
ncbi:hypothetical protein JCM14076_04570 [Methylosoma difficile]